MPLPRYQPVKKKLKSSSQTLVDLDDGCLSRIIAFALEQAKLRDHEPYVGDNGKTERNLSLVSKRWYFLTQIQVSDHGVHKIDLEEALKRMVSSKPVANRFATSANYAPASTMKTPRHVGLHASVGMASSRKPGIGGVGTASARKRLPYGILTQRNLTVTNGNQQVNDKTAPASQSYDIKLFRAIHPKLLKYKHVQLSGTLAVDNFDKLLSSLNSARVERLDLLKVRIENAHSLSTGASGVNLTHLQALTFTWTNSPDDDHSNAILWQIYDRAVNLRELEVYLLDECNNLPTIGASNTSGNNDDSQRSSESTRSAPASLQRAASDFSGKRIASLMPRRHPRLCKIVFDRLAPAAKPAEPVQQQQSAAARGCEYASLIKYILAHEPSVLALDTNDCSLVDYLIHASARLCTRRELSLLKLTHPLRSLELLNKLIKLPNLGTSYLSIVMDDFEQIGDMKLALENFALVRKARARCQLNLYLRDQKFPDSEEKVKQLINLCRLVDVNVYISALQRISIDCCHLMWSTGRALQAVTADLPGKCIFRISLQTYPIKANTVNPCEITVPFGRCAQYKISGAREDVVRHREIMKALKRDCYHQFVKSVRDNNAP